MKQIKINSLLWDAENLEIEGKTHFTFSEAQEAAKSIGKRLPTREECKSLVSLWYRWDDKRKGYRFRDDEGGEVFIPAAGVILIKRGEGQSAGEVQYIGSTGDYWSGTEGYQKYETAGHALRLCRYQIRATDSCYGDHRFSVRCVKDIHTNVECRESNSNDIKKS